MTAAMAEAENAYVEVIRQQLKASFEEAEPHVSPYPFWIADNMLPAPVAARICALPFAAPELDGTSGRREIHNASRNYFDAAVRERYPVAKAVTDIFQAAETVTQIERLFGASLEGTFLRAEYAQDVNGFWLEPHSDLGVKKFTLLLYLSVEPEHADLGTDIYTVDKARVGRSPFRRGTGMIFVPSDKTIHGFEHRPIRGVRKSLIINYVTDAWRAREQLAFPDEPIGFLGTH